VESLWQFDLATFRAINLGWRSPFADVFFLVFSYLGLGQVQVGLALLWPLLATAPPDETAAGWRRWWGRVRRREFHVLALILSVLVSGTLIAQLFKRVIKRERPSQLEWAVAQEEWRISSFPSGHTITAFAVAFYIAMVTWKTPRWYAGPIAVTLAIFVGLSRIYRGVHWPTDVFAGACGGLVTACILYLFFSDRSARSLA